MPPIRDERPSLFGRLFARLLAFLGLYTRSEAERYAHLLGERTRDYNRRMATLACAEVARECEHIRSRQGWRALPPAKVARACADRIAALPLGVTAKDFEREEESDARLQ